MDSEIKQRMVKAGGVFAGLRNCLWKCKEISIRTKASIFKASVLPVMLYGAETWTLAADDISRLSSFYMDCLRAIIGRRKCWRLKTTNEDVLNQCNMMSMDDILKQKRLRWLGHVCRMSDQRVPKQLLFSKHGEKRKNGNRPRWTTRVMKDLSKMDCKDTVLEDVTDRGKWKKKVANSINSS